MILLSSFSLYFSAALEILLVTNIQKLRQFKQISYFYK